VECMGEKYDQGFGEETRVIETTRVGGRIILKRILKKWARRTST